MKLDAIVGGAPAWRNVTAHQIGTGPAEAALTQMGEKRLTGDKLILADAAKLEKKLQHRSKRVLVLALFLVIALVAGAWRLYALL